MSLPTLLAHLKIPHLGTVWAYDFEGHEVQVYLTEKQKRIRVHVNGKEWSPK